MILIILLNMNERNGGVLP